MTRSHIKLALIGGIFAVVSFSPVTPSKAMTPLSQTHSPSARLSGSSIVSTAMSYVGSPYAWIGDQPSGFSCVGFVHFVMSQYGYNTPEDVGALYSSYQHVAASDMQPGDVLIFANTFHAGLSHAALYIGGGQMIGADNFSVGVHVDSVYDSYWGPRFVTAVRVMSSSLSFTAPIPATPTPQPVAPAVVRSFTHTDTTARQSVRHTLSLHGLSHFGDHESNRLSQALYRFSCSTNVSLPSWSWYWLQPRAPLALQ